jgi:glycosidase
MKIRRLLLCLAAIGGALACGAQNLNFGLQNARAVPDFVNRATIYQVWMRGYTPEGTLKATASRLPHIAGLGASIVYLSPLQVHSLAGGAAKGWTEAGPYGIKNYSAVDPGYGTEADLKEFVAKAHELGLKVIQDVVFYHMAIDNELVNVPGFPMRTANAKLILGNWGRPRPDFANPKVREHLAANLVHWVRDVGIDGFRCDVAAGVPLSFWEQAREALDRVNPNVVLLAEAESPEQQLKVFDISYNFSYLKTLRSVLLDGEPAVRIRESWEKQHTAWPRGARLLYYSDNHDQDRASRLLGERAAYAAAVLNFTLDGIPFLYGGQEIGDATPTNYPERAPQRWELGTRSATGRQQAATLAKYRKLFGLRKQEPALFSGELVWLNNSAPESVLTFLRTSGDDRILVAINLSNRKLPLTVDLPAADFMPATELLTGTRRSTAFSPGRVEFPSPLGAFEALVLKRLPRQLAAGPAGR